MATCKDCIHYEVCVVIENLLDKEQNIYGEFGCEDFKNNADVVEVKHGEWEQYGLRNPQCSLCRSYHIEKSRYCPNCGAKMDGELNDL